MLRESKVTIGTWCERPGTAYTIRKGHLTTSERISVHIWTDTNEMVLSHIKGDGRDRENFKRFDTKTIFNGTREDVRNYVQQHLEKEIA